MAIILRDLEQRTGEAVAHYWRTLDEQARRQTAGDADRGARSAVTGGQQMMGFSRLVRDLLQENGVPEASILVQSYLDLPGFFRPTKSWDMLVVNGGRLVAALEFKSQRGPSFGNNFNNRTEEAIGTAQDLWTAFREGAFVNSPRPWLGWAMLVEDCKRSTAPVKVSEPHFRVFPEFRGASYMRRYELLLRRLRLEKLYDGAMLLTATASGGPEGKYAEPAEDLRIREFLAGLLGHALADQAIAR